MNQLEESLALISIEIPLDLLAINIALTALLALVLARFYIRFGQSLSNRSRLARNFILIATTTALIITIVKSSLALSLGLVGALSIVRFRAAIKEPEELAYLFLAITLGLGFGANQVAVTSVSFFIILLLLYLQHLFHLSPQKENLFITIKLPKNKRGKKNQLTTLIKHLSQGTTKLDLRRVEDTTDELNLGCLAEFKSPEELQKLTTLLRQEYPRVHILLIDSSDIIG